MEIKPIDDGNSNFELVYLHSDSEKIMKTPHCKNHGAMNKVSKFTDSNGGYWRCHVELCRSGCIQIN